MYDINYFIKKYKAIPEENFCEEYFNESKPGVHCYIGHNGTTEEKFALGKILWENLHISPWELIAGHVEEYNHLSLKQRIIAALKDIKAKNPASKKPDKLDVLVERYEKQFAKILEREYVSNVT